jgi:hypothetical protein
MGKGIPWLVPQAVVCPHIVLRIHHMENVESNILLKSDIVVLAGCNFCYSESLLEKFMKLYLSAKGQNEIRPITFSITPSPY